MGVKEEKKPKKSRSLTRPRLSITIPPLRLKVSRRPQGDSLRRRSGQAHPCYPDEDRGVLGRKKGPERIRASRIVWRPQGDSNPCYRRERPVSLAG